MLFNAPVFGYADFSKPFVIEIDPIHQGLGATLSQEQDGKEKVRDIYLHLPQNLRGATTTVEWLLETKAVLELVCILDKMF